MPLPATIRSNLSPLPQSRGQMQSLDTSLHGRNMRMEGDKRVVLVDINDNARPAMTDTMRLLPKSLQSVTCMRELRQGEVSD